MAATPSRKRPVPSRKPTKSARLEFIEPMMARLVAELPAGDEWLYEVKWDGYRILAMKDGNSVRLLSRKGKELTKDFPSVADAVRAINAKTAILDGEVVALDKSGRPSFQMLQHRAAREGFIAAYVFDLLHLNGRDWRDRPLEERKARLAELVADTNLRFSVSLDGPPDHIAAQVKKLGLEGVIAKQRGSVYRSGERSHAWQKFKMSPEQEFVIGGFRPGSPLESLVVGYYDADQLLCAGKARQGLNPRNRRELFTLLEPLRTTKCPFDNLPNSQKGHWGEGITAEQMAELRWVKPKVVAQISFTEWTRGGNLRHGEFKGLREDKSPQKVVRESRPL